MPSETRIQNLDDGGGPAATADPCILVVFGASGDLMKRLLMPALYNLARDRMLADGFAIVGVARQQATTEEFRERMSDDIKKFNTSSTFDPAVWEKLARGLHYLTGDYADPATYRRLEALLAKVDDERRAGGNVVYYLAVPPDVFGTISKQLAAAELTTPKRGWARLIVEKPFGRDLASAIALNRELRADWSEEQIYRIDHYLGKETVQNLLAFRFCNGMFEPVWNKNHVDHIQLTVTELVGVEGRGRYFDQAGVMRDMLQNHMLQMLAYLCMEPPVSFRPGALRDEKGKLMSAVRVLKPADVPRNAVRGQYGPGRKPDGTEAIGYRQEPNVDPQSGTETFAALRIFIDNWRWEGVPIYLRSGKSLWQRGTEIVVQFKKAPEAIFRGTPAARLESNKLVFRIQPDQGIELRFQAKSPGPALRLQNVHMRFDYQEAFQTSRGTGYEVLFYNCMIGDTTLFSRADLIELSWQIAQPILDVWASTVPEDFPNYPAGSWGPKAAYDLLERDGRHWLEVINRSVLEKVPLFQDCACAFLQNLALTLKPDVFEAGEEIIRKGEDGHEMYFISRGQVEVLDEDGQREAVRGEGEFFGELSLLLPEPRSNTVRALTLCNLFVLSKADFDQMLKDHPPFAATIREAVKRRYKT